MHRFEMDSTTPVPEDRERYLRKMSDRLHDRFLEKPAFLDLDFIRSEIKKLDSQIDELLASGLTWERAQIRLGDPVEYADAVFATRLLSPEVQSKASKPSVLVTVLKVLFVVAPVNFLVALGPLLVGLILILLGWVFSVVVLLGPLVFIVRLLIEQTPSIGPAEIALLVAVFAFGQLMVLAMLTSSRLLYWAVWSWLGWNIAFLRAEPRS